MSVICLCLCFKQKTAYEMRMSDWSSDVCSSDLSCTTKFNFSYEGSTGPGGIPLGSDSGGNAGSTAPIPNAYVSFQLSPDWFAGLGISAPFGLSTEYNDDWIGRYQSTRFSLETINVNPSLAYKVNQRFSLGAGLNWQYLDADYRPNVPAAGITPLLAALPDISARAKLSGDAWGWNVGMLDRRSTRLNSSH